VAGVTASPPGTRVGMTSPMTGAARTAALPKSDSRWLEVDRYVIGGLGGAPATRKSR